jgi:multidrug efflux system outer membrane protein
MRSLVLVVATFIAGCAAGPSYRTPDTPMPDQFAGAGAAAYTAAAVPSKFWTVWGDEVLDGLIDDALKTNHDIRIAAARLREARALRRDAGYDFLPTIIGNGSVTRQKFSEFERPDLPADALTFELYDAGFDAAWEIDFFGRVRRGYEARGAELGGALATLEDAFVTLTSEIARNYVEMRGLQNRYEVAKRNADNQRNTFEVTRARLDGGRGTELDVARAQAQLSTTLATLPELEASIARAQFRLAVLTGKRPGELNERLAARPMVKAAQFTPVGDPGEWLRRRPDVRIAERNLAAATARIGVETAELFPKVTLFGNFGWTGLEFENIGDGGFERYRYGPSISWAIFDLGHVRARISAAEARADGALAQYEQTVLRALEDTEGSLITYSRAREREAALTEAAAASGKATQLARLRYEGGISDFLDVLDAERTLLEAEDRLAQSQADSATALVAVYKALGAGWQEIESPYMPKRTADAR